MIYRVTLPWPSSALSPNARGHWAAKARHAKLARQDAWVLAMKAGLRGVGWSSARVAIEFCPPDRRKRDLDNMLASLKPSLDGIVDLIGVDDADWSISITRGEPVKGGAVVVTIERGGE